RSNFAGAQVVWWWGSVRRINFAGAQVVWWWGSGVGVRCRDGGDMMTGWLTRVLSAPGRRPA
ncbi:MAG: hypothetical protein LOY02_10685, partial [Intrasporangium sp.]|nr:hypothetical protein [Intrasporangium sp.]